MKFMLIVNAVDLLQVKVKIDATVGKIIWQKCFNLYRFNNSINKVAFSKKVQ